MSQPLREAPLEPGVGDRARVLVVDDERALRESLARLLGEEHAVETAGSAAAALDRLRSGALFDVILSDVMMPQGSGLDLHDAIARELPSLAARLVFMTGGLHGDARERLAKIPNVCLDKPVDLNRLRGVIHRTAPRDLAGVEDLVIGVIGRELHATRGRLDLETRLADDLRADSLALVELTLALEETFDVDITDAEAAQVQTVRDAVAVVRRQLRARRGGP